MASPPNAGAIPPAAGVAAIAPVAGERKAGGGPGSGERNEDCAAACACAKGRGGDRWWGWVDECGKGPAVVIVAAGDAADAPVAEEHPPPVAYPSAS